MTRLATAVLLLALGSPGGALAFSFGVFTPGDTIESLTIEPGDGMSFAPGAPGTLSVNAEISTIDMTSGDQFGGISGLRFETVMDLSGAPLFLGPIGPTVVFADFTAGSVTIRDDGAGPVGSGPVLLTGSFEDLTTFQAAFPGINGSLAGAFGGIAGDPDFTAAFGSGADLNLQLTAFVSGGGPATQVCQIGNSCIGPTTAFRAWDAEPVATVNPVVLPEPTGSLLLGAGLAGIALLRRRRKACA
jgi:hypothetical protein